MHVLIPGSYDPITLGHMAIIRRAASLFSRVTVGIFQNENKTYLCTPPERIAMVKEACRSLPNVDVIYNEGYVADYCHQNGISLLVRGVRDASDLPFEKTAADYNRAHGVETLLFLAEEAAASLSSTEVRRRLAAGESVDALVPAEILPLLPMAKE